MTSLLYPLLDPLPDPAEAPAAPSHWLLTPGPLTTTATVKRAMLHDWGSWDGDFRALTASIRHRLRDIAGVGEDYTVVPMQGSGTFAVESALTTLVPPDGGVLIPVNGAYGQRMVEICRRAGVRHAVLEIEETSALDPQAVAQRLADDPTLSHVALVQVETSTGILNPVDEVAQVTAAAGRRLIVDAMSAFGALWIDPAKAPYEALVFSTNKCLEGVPGMGFVLTRVSALEEARARGPGRSLSLDLVDQWAYMERTGQFRYTPATHVLAAFRQALDEFDAEGGRTARYARYRRNYDVLIAGMAWAGIKPLLPEALRSPIIVTFLAPVHPAYSFTAFYDAMKRRGFIIYPGKMTRVESFRLGCIGAIDVPVMEECTRACVAALKEIGVEVQD
ncbi:2-aminoethylphosphonate--pyruvate transaminase [Pararhodospirillum oryzae]|uniref:2-aminoethylphosphonate--pyruvate transaminase n=1 Tax=Pararhodospirillum oryzae TaxID=478448 RepID=A0A512H5R5_9PROT|nr:2-aminoethylphosphonate--pyruvate transaminase [Pararhodospirillum oryzae]GEO80764.1 2-aminoethylphosphonate--pyruvate transaminase [Pararhodospirillum oryzae]